MSEELKQAIIEEANRKQTDALYTFVGLFEWHKTLRIYKNIFLGSELLIVAACVGTLQANQPIIGSILGIVAGLGPAVVDAFKLDERLSQTTNSANDFRSLREKYRRIAEVWSNKPIRSLEMRFAEVNSEFNAVAKLSPPLPKKHFEKAQEIINSGDYDYD